MSLEPQYGTDLIKTLASGAKNIGDTCPVLNSCEPTIPYINDTIAIIKCPNNGEYTTSTDPDSTCITSMDWGFKGDVGFDAGWSWDLLTPWSTGDATGSTSGQLDKYDVMGNVYLGSNQQSDSNSFLDMTNSFSVDPSITSDDDTITASINPSITFDDSVKLPFPGLTATCTRTAFNAPAAACCMTDNSPNSFSDGTLVALTGDINNPVEDSYVTCDPDYTNYDNSACDNPVASFCSTDGNYSDLGGIMNNKAFKQWKIGNSCNTYAKSSASASGKLLTLEQSIVALNKKYPIDSLDRRDTDAIDAWKGVQDACNANPGVCDGSLNFICAGQTRDEISGAGKRLDDDANSVLFDLCACHLPASQYLQYAGIIDEGAYNECDPLCMAPGVLQQGNSNGFASCSEVNCVIDDTTIDIINSSVGTVNIDQVCGNGNGSGSDCYFTDADVFSQGSAAPNISFDQDCGSCFIYQNDNPYNPIPVACSGSGSAGSTPIGWKAIGEDIDVQFESVFDSLMSWIKNSPLIALTVIGLVLLVIIIAVAAFILIV